MENFSTENPKKGKKKNPTADCEEESAFMFFGSIGLGKDDIFIKQVPDSQVNYTVPQIQELVEESNPISNSNGVPKIQELEEESNSISKSNEVPKIQELEEESNSNSNGVSQIPNLKLEDEFSAIVKLTGDDLYRWLTDEETPVTQESSQRYSNSGHHNSLFNIEDLAAESSSNAKSRSNSLHGYPWRCDFMNKYGSLPCCSVPCCDDLKWHGKIPNHQTSDVGQKLSYGYNRMTVYEPRRQNELWEASLRMAQAQKHSKYMEHVMSLFEEADYNQREKLLPVLRGSVLWIMVDEQLHHLFQKVVDVCEEEQLNPIVEEVFSQQDLFIDAAFCREGSNSIVKLIRKLKKTEYAFTMTSILATRFYELTTDQTARIVIQQCLYILGNGPNKVLYEQAILYFKHLAVNQAGCRSLNECINTIAGNQRTRLLLRIARVSDFLSHDPFGNYVVQHVLSLQNEKVNAKIFSRLQGHFVLLAQKKGGSHVVEKCLESCSSGTLYVVKDILQCERTPILLARDQCGNYVIQSALKMTMNWGFTGLYRSLVEALEPHYKELKRTVGGKQVISIMGDGIYYKRPQSKFNGKDNGYY